MYNKKTHVHFMGIGGIGMSGIAQILIHRGYKVSGCDTNMHQKSILDLQELGCNISQNHAQTSCFDPSINLLVYSSAIPKDHPEIIHARTKKITVIHRAVLLAELMRTKYSIAVAGSHGKTTTTALIGHIFTHAKLAPTIIVGGHMQIPDIKNSYDINPKKNNAQQGAGELFIVETDESDRSLLQLNPTLAVLTNSDL